MNVHERASERIQQISECKTNDVTSVQTAFRTDGRQWAEDCVLNVVRAALLFDDMGGFVRCLDAICARTDEVEVSE